MITDPEARGKGVAVAGRAQSRYKIGEPLKEAPLPEGWLDDYITAEAGLKQYEMPGAYFVQGVRFAEAHYDVAGREKYRLNPGQEQWVRDAITDAYEAGARAQIDGTRHVGKHTRQYAKHFIGAINDWASADPSVLPAQKVVEVEKAIAAALRQHGLTLLKNASCYEVDAMGGPWLSQTEIDNGPHGHLGNTPSDYAATPYSQDSLIAGHEVVTHPGAAIRATVLHLTNSGRDILTAKGVNAIPQPQDSATPAPADALVQLLAVVDDVSNSHVRNRVRAAIMEYILPPHRGPIVY